MTPDSWVIDGCRSEFRELLTPVTSSSFSSCRRCSSVCVLRLPGGGAELPPGALLHGSLSTSGILYGRGGRVAPQLRRPSGVSGGPELAAAVSPPAGLQVSARLPPRGALSAGLLDRQVCRYLALAPGFFFLQRSYRSNCSPFLCLFFLAYDEYDVSPYEELEVNLVRNIEMSHMASIMAGGGTVPHFLLSLFFFLLLQT